MVIAPTLVDQRVRVWDLPTRIAHWTLLGLFGLCWWTESAGEMAWHVLAGSALLATLLFRIAWGFVGSQTARFASFVHSPAVVIAYARGLFAGNCEPSGPVGHNPMGGWSVLTMLAFLLAETGLGLIAIDSADVASGPLANWVGIDVGRWATRWHAGIFLGLLGLIGLHVAAIAFYAIGRRDNLISPMLSGYKRMRQPQPIHYFAPTWLAMVIAVVVGLCVSLLMVAGSVSRHVSAIGLDRSTIARNVQQ
jgi:cytochrome b